MKTLIMIDLVVALIAALLIVIYFIRNFNHHFPSDTMIITAAKVRLAQLKAEAEKSIEASERVQSEIKFLESIITIKKLG